MDTTRQLLFLELNEVNFESLEYYAARGKLPAFRAFFDRHSYARTTSETHYEQLEPWIQWVTAHTGLDFEDHKVFRLGDIIHHDIPQIWEQLEALGYRTGAISPMNAKHRLTNPAFFIPDPWTSTDVSAPPIFERLYRAIAEVVNENASGRMSGRSALDLALGSLAVAQLPNYAQYLRLVASAKTKPWTRALFLDLLLTDLFTNCVKRTNPHFATLFLNAAAHIQHHYMFSSAAYDGSMRNPTWYVAEKTDPVLEVYQLYDQVLANIQASFPSARIMLATALHQDPHDETTFYWRLADHNAHLRKIGIAFSQIEPRMSRDFLVICETPAQAAEAQTRLESARTDDGRRLYSVDNRGHELFVMLSFADDIPANCRYFVGNSQFENLRDEVAFVAIKNGQHNSIGYFSDSGGGASPPVFPLKEIPSRIMTAFGHEAETQALWRTETLF